MRLTALLAGLTGLVLLVPTVAADEPQQRTPALGGGGGSPFTILCGKGYVLTGLRGRAAAVVDRIGLLCRPVREDGTLGAETIRGDEVGGTGGSPESASCDPGSVVTRLTVFSGAFVDLISFGCKAWDPKQRRASGDDLSQGKSLGTRGTPQSGVIRCELASQPANGFHGRAGSVLDSVGLICDEPGVLASAGSGGQSGPALGGGPAGAGSAKSSGGIQSGIGSGARAGAPSGVAKGGPASGAATGGSAPAGGTVGGAATGSATAAAVVDDPPQKTAIFGGSGGSSFDLDCGSGFVLTGLRTRAAAVIDRMGLLCRPLRPDGSLGPETTRDREVGGGGGSSGSRSCPAGSVVSGLKMKVGSFVDSVFLLCRAWRPASRDMGTVTADGLHTGGYGGLAAASRTLTCESSRQPGAGIRGRAAGVVDAIGLVCDEP